MRRAPDTEPGKNGLAGSPARRAQGIAGPTPAGSIGACAPQINFLEENRMAEQRKVFHGSIAYCGGRYYHPMLSRYDGEIVLVEKTGKALKVHARNGGRICTAKEDVFS